MNVKNKQEILIIVKTYPEYSQKYTETVCTAGILKGNRKLVRLYPIRFRYLAGKNQFQKYQWVKAVLSKARTDVRPESYTIESDSIELGSIISTKQDWAERTKWVLSAENVFHSVEELQSKREKHNTSMGLLKPAEIIRFEIVRKSEMEMKEAEIKKAAIMAQRDMFEDRKDLEIIPFRFLLNFKCNDATCKGHRYSILDWEIAQLYRNVKGDPNWKEKITDKIDQICASSKDTYLILGNMASHQHVFCVLGMFYPPKQRQLSLL